MPGETKEIPHRKNAAEWLMWICLQPVAWIARAVASTKRSNKEE